MGRGMPARGARPEGPVARASGQVRIAAGALVLLGIGLGLGVHFAFLGLTAFVGAGRVFDKVTDHCGMQLFIGCLYFFFPLTYLVLHRDDDSPAYANVSPPCVLNLSLAKTTRTDL